MYDRHDLARIKLLLERHLHYTNSARAQTILDDWNNTIARFIKVMPVDFRRAIAKLDETRIENVTETHAR